VIRYKRLFGDVEAPHRAHDYDVAFDVYAYENANLVPGVPHRMRTGLIVTVPIGYAILVLPRSGLATEHGVTVVNSPGLVDPGYRGELGISLINHGRSAYRVEKGNRIGQLLVVQYAQANISEGDLHDPPDQRGAGGFGSTGK
jgi:dUTP pyrophosphatase